MEGSRGQDAQQAAGRLLSDIRRYLEAAPEAAAPCRDNVELGLEIEINESLKRVLTTPDSGSDELLDVTIIRPSDSEVARETTVALNKEEVRDFITLVEQHQKNKLRQGPRCKGEPPDHIPASRNQQQQQQQQRESTISNQSSWRSTVSPKSGTSRGGTPCVCQHCGVKGVLVQSNKNQSQSANSQASQKPRPASPRSNQTFAQAKEVMLLREINTRIKSLEKRMAAQEESAVPRDYLKHVLHRVLTQYKEQQQQQMHQQRGQNVRNAGTQYVSENRDSHHKKGNKGKHYQIHTLLHTPTIAIPQQTHEIGEPSSTSHNSEVLKHPVYYWGEEVVAPGSDLKTKILDLLQEKMIKPDCAMTPNQNQQPKVSAALPEKLQKSDVKEIKIERDDNLLFLGNMKEISTCNIDNYVNRSKPPEIHKKMQERVVENFPSKLINASVPESLRPQSIFRNQITPDNAFKNHANPSYPYDLKRTFDDSTFRKNIEAQKERFKIEPKIPEELYNCPTENVPIRNDSTASMELLMKKLKNNVMEPSFKNERDKLVENNRRHINQFSKLNGSIIKDNMIARGFRDIKGCMFEPKPEPAAIPIDVKYINPKITRWSEESTASEEKYQKHARSNEKDSIPVETKESLIYKLEFLKNLAKHKSADQSKVLNKIWTQAKKTAKSKNDAVFIKIPFKSVNSVEPRNNVIEMQLTLEQLETVVKSVNKGNNNAATTAPIPKTPSYKSSSDVNIAWIRQEEIRRANMDVLKRRRNFSAKADKNK